MCIEDFKEWTKKYELINCKMSSLQVRFKNMFYENQLVYHLNFSWLSNNRKK